MRRIRTRLTFANVVSLSALFVTLGGTALASVIITSNSQVASNTISGHKPPSGKHPNVIAGVIRFDLCCEPLDPNVADDSAGEGDCRPCECDQHSSSQWLVESPRSRRAAGVANAS